MWIGSAIRWGMLLLFLCLKKSAVSLSSHFNQEMPNSCHCVHDWRDHKKAPKFTLFSFGFAFKRYSNNCEYMKIIYIELRIKPRLRVAVPSPPPRWGGGESTATRRLDKAGHEFESYLRGNEHHLSNSENKVENFLPWTG